MPKRIIGWVRGTSASNQEWTKGFDMHSFVLAVLIAGLLPVVCAGIAKWGAKGYNNHDPRAWLAQQEGRRARAHAAQQNSFEAFPLFAVGVALAWHGGADPDTLALWCWTFVALRLAYIGCYITDRASLRSVVWVLGVAVSVRLYLMA
jgi:uncharacterized MAPEG superfamily protein